MSDFYRPDGVGPFYTDEDGYIPSGSDVLAINEASAPTGVSCYVIVALQVNTGVLQMKTREATAGIITGAESDWVNVPIV